MWTQRIKAAAFLMEFNQQSPFSNVAPSAPNETHHLGSQLVTLNNATRS